MVVRRLGHRPYGAVGGAARLAIMFAPAKRLKRRLMKTAVSNVIDFIMLWLCILIRRLRCQEKSGGMVEMAEWG